MQIWDSSTELWCLTCLARSAAFLNCKNASTLSLWRKEKYRGVTRGKLFCLIPFAIAVFYHHERIIGTWWLLQVREQKPYIICNNRERATSGQHKQPFTSQIIVSWQMLCIFYIIQIRIPTSMLYTMDPKLYLLFCPEPAHSNVYECHCVWEVLVRGKCSQSMISCLDLIVLRCVL